MYRRVACWRKPLYEQLAGNTGDNSSGSFDFAEHVLRCRQAAVSLWGNENHASHSGSELDLAAGRHHGRLGPIPTAAGGTAMSEPRAGERAGPRGLSWRCDLLLRGGTAGQPV